VEVVGKFKTLVCIFLKGRGGRGKCGQAKEKNEVRGPGILNATFQDLN
jgi:hypothetical protein